MDKDIIILVDFTALPMPPHRIGQQPVNSFIDDSGTDFYQVNEFLMALCVLV